MDKDVATVIEYHKIEWTRISGLKATAMYMKINICNSIGILFEFNFILMAIRAPQIGYEVFLQPYCC